MSCLPLLNVLVHTILIETTVVTIRLFSLLERKEKMVSEGFIKFLCDGDNSKIFQERL